MCLGQAGRRLRVLQVTFELRVGLGGMSVCWVTYGAQRVGYAFTHLIGPLSPISCSKSEWFLGFSQCPDPQ